MNHELSHEEELRYNRQIVLPEFGFEGQIALKSAKILIIGIGGLGCAAAQSLTASGVGELTLVDDDRVELSNLQRQILHTESRLGMSKVESAKQALLGINRNLHLNLIAKQLDKQSLNEQISHHQLVLDCTDNLPSREMINQACFHQQVPLISGAAIRCEGQVVLFDYADSTPCYHCLSQLYGELPTSCIDTGVLSPVVTLIGTQQALAAIRWLSGLGRQKTGILQLFDGRTNEWRELAIPKQPSCRVCGHMA